MAYWNIAVSGTSIYGKRASPAQHGNGPARHDDGRGDRRALRAVPNRHAGLAFGPGMALWAFFRAVPARQAWQNWRAVPAHIPIHMKDVRKTHLLKHLNISWFQSSVL